MSAARTLGFIVTSIPCGDGQFRSVQRFQCVECGDVLDRTNPSGTNNPELAAKWAVGKGWKADAWKKNLCWCPRCAGPQRKAKNDPNSELKKVVPLNNPVAIREATGEQKQRIRSLLDKHFDDGVGCFIDGMSDQRIAELIGIPRILVEQIREAAYGPIKVSAEVVEMRAQMAEGKAA